MPGPLPLDEQLCFSLYAATIAINRAYKPVLDHLGITYPQFLVLQVLSGAEDGVPVGTIAERLALEPSTITPLAKRMEAAGLVTRLRNPADERQVRVRLTDAGRDRWRTARGAQRRGDRAAPGTGARSGGGGTGRRLTGERQSLRSARAPTIIRRAIARTASSSLLPSPAGSPR
jgi:DNA-binding MarR family transcriptional regulator